MRLAGILIALLIAAGATVFGELYSFNHFDRIEHAFDGQCAPVQGIAGPGDIRVDPRRRLAFISSFDWRTKGARGAIHIFDLDDPLSESGWRDRTDGAPAAFEPLGLDYYEDGDVRRLFVVNGANHAVELFDVGDDGALKHIETFTEPRMTSPNSVVAVGPRSFYVTNDARSGRASLAADVRFLTRSASGEVLFTDGTSWRLAAEGLRFANGIALSPDGERLYVAETAGGAIRVFERNAETENLSAVDTIELNTFPDNLMVDPSGVLWIAALPKPLATPRHRADPAARAPSEVIRIGADGKPQTVYRDDGTELSASTAAARMGSTLLIGALYDEKFLICRLPGGAI